jgi:hypothetical protein
MEALAILLVLIAAWVLCTAAWLPAANALLDAIEGSNPIGATMAKPPRKPQPPAAPAPAPVQHALAPEPRAAVTHVTHAAPVRAPESPAVRKRSRAAEKQARYRERHGDDYRQSHAAYMRAWRAGQVGKGHERRAAPQTL